MDNVWKAVQTYHGRGVTLPLPRLLLTVSLWNFAIVPLRPARAPALAPHSTAISIDPNNANAYHNRGSTLDKLNQLDAAIADFTKAISLDSTNASTYNSRGLAYDSQVRTIGESSSSEMRMNTMQYSRPTDQRKGTSVSVSSVDIC